MKVSLTIFLLLISNLVFATNTIKVGITQNLLTNYTHFLNGKSVYDIQEYDGEGARRSVIEVVLLLQALKAGGLQHELEWAIQPNYARTKRSLQFGKISLSASSLWIHDINEMQHYVIASAPIVAEGEYQAGLFKLAGNPLSISSIDDLPALTAISVQTWIPDWNTLTHLPLKDVIDANKWDTMIKLLAGGRGDFILSSFKSSDDMGFTEGEHRFIPINNVKVSLIGSRHFAISVQQEHSQALASSLNRGIKILRAKGTINKAFTQAGFYNARVKDWTDLSLQ